MSLDIIIAPIRLLEGMVRRGVARAVSNGIRDGFQDGFKDALGLDIEVQPSELPAIVAEKPTVKTNGRPVSKATSSKRSTAKR